MLRMFTLLILLGLGLPATAAKLASTPVRVAQDSRPLLLDGVVEAVRQSQISAQVAGSILRLPVRAGDTVKAGQLLAQIDARSANQTASASRAQTEAARATLDIARKEFERQQQLFRQRFISQAALDQAEARFKAARAEVEAQTAQASAARTQSDYFSLTAPYAGVVADVAVSQGDMAQPGRPLLTLYDPTALRVALSVPEAWLTQLDASQPVRLELPGLPVGQNILISRQISQLPAANAQTHSRIWWLSLPAGNSARPGQFARVWLPTRAEGRQRYYLPSRSIVQRAELSAVYVIDDKGQPLLRQVRPGRSLGDETEILSGIAAGEQVALDPLAATAAR
ncbi:efflux RND transporter periplasmic adaptor subunit [Parachitinimonas caeni]|uniref:Efflux RND transporter periplasmic adaptor subunit n=1 Tax=Parachitinimonas caeni TaxID=3031301 RepID=A0ABT7DVQ9_9NEIS|nr:efflux RND transporter periplasmic adaptor subunit [Parachitinimonas caeni]MDK2122742.1 efflux RND transporter periplasmic adaptor subunit [Parachitinimonas caeni]